MKISKNIGLNLPEGTDNFDHDKFLTKNFEKVDQYLMSATNVDAEFNKVNSSLADIAHNPVSNGAKFDGVTDDSTAIQNTINEVALSGGGEVLITGIVGLAKPIEIKSGVVLHSYNATLKALADINIIEFNQNTKIKGSLKIDVSNITYTKSALHFNGTKFLSYRDITIEEVYLQGKNADGLGNAIHFDCSMANSTISFVRFGRVVIRGFSKGVFLDAPAVSTTTYNYINGNVIDNLTISDCDYYIYGTGDHSSNTRNQVDGNQFKNVQLQYNNRTFEVIHLEGWGNSVEGTVWDVKTGEIIRLTASSKYNNVYFPNLEAPSKYTDFGQFNTIKFATFNQHHIPIKDNLTYKNGYFGGYKGDYEDILHKANVTTTLNNILGNENVTGGSLNNVFNGNINTGLNLDLSNNKQYSFEMVFNKGMIGSQSAYLYGGFRYLGFFFLFNRYPKTIVLEVTESSETVTTTTIDSESKQFLPAIILEQSSINRLATDIAKLKITLIGQASTDVRLGRIFGNSYLIGGTKYISNGGGFMAGNMEFATKDLGIIMKSPNSSRYILAVADDGTISAKKI